MDRKSSSANGCDSSGSRTDRMSFKNIIVIFVCIVFSTSAWGTVFVEWNEATLPPPTLLGLKQIVVAWERDSAAALLATARKQGYSVFVETPLKQAASAAKTCAERACAGIFLSVLESENAEAEKSIASLQSAYPQLS